MDISSQLAVQCHHTDFLLLYIMATLGPTKGFLMIYQLMLYAVIYTHEDHLIDLTKVTCKTTEGFEQYVVLIS